MGSSTHLMSRAFPRDHSSLHLTSRTSSPSTPLASKEGRFYLAQRSAFLFTDFIMGCCASKPDRRSHSSVYGVYCPSSTSPPPSYITPSPYRQTYTPASPPSTVSVPATFRTPNPTVYEPLQHQTYSPAPSPPIASVPSAYSPSPSTPTLYKPNYTPAPSRPIASVPAAYSPSPSTAKEPTFPLSSSPHCRRCSWRPKYRDTVKPKNPNGNVGRHYYICFQCKKDPTLPSSSATSGPNGKGWITWDDRMGIDSRNPRCKCGTLARQNRAGVNSYAPGQGFWTCSTGACGYVSWREDGREGWAGDEGFRPWLV